jgi:hypothetical protein
MLQPGSVVRLQHHLQLPDDGDGGTRDALRYPSRAAIANQRKLPSVWRDKTATDAPLLDLQSLRDSDGPYCCRNSDHCPWVGTCVGHHNRKYFVNFLTYTTLGLAQMLLFLRMQGKL